MSKLFNQTIKAQQTVTETESFPSSAEQLLGIIKHVEGPARELSSSRLTQTRTITLAASGRAPLLIAGEYTDHTAAEAYRALRTRVLRLQGSEGIRSITVSSAVPGDGKTVTTINLGLCYAQVRNRKVVVVDGDLRTHGLTRLLGVQSGPGLSEVLAGEATFEDSVAATNHPNFYVVSAGRSGIAAPELLETERWKEYLNWLSETFNLVLLDSPPVRPLADFELLSAGADRILMVVRALKTQREILQKCVSSIDSKKLMGIVFNASHTPVNKKHAYYYAASPGEEIRTAG